MLTRVVVSQERRRFLATGATTMGLLTVGHVDTQSNTVEITSDGGGVAVYEFTTSGTVSKTSSSTEDTVRENYAYGHLGPKRGTDTFNYSGSITGFKLAGPATVTRNGSAIDPNQYSHTPGSITSESFSSRSGTNTIRIESDGGGMAAYEFTVTGNIEKGPKGEEDTVRDNWGYGHLGPKRGVDDFNYTGDVTSFVLAGPATVYQNEQALQPPGQSSPDSDSGIEAVDRYRQAIQQLEALGNKPGHPSEREWYNNAYAEIQRTRDAVESLVNQNYQFDVSVGNQVTVEITESPSYAPALGVEGVTGRRTNTTLAGFTIPTIVLITTVSVGAPYLYLGIQKAVTLAVGAANYLGGQIPSAAAALAKLYASEPYLFMFFSSSMTNPRMQAAAGCQVANALADATIDNPDLSATAQVLADRAGGCEVGVGEIVSYAKEKFTGESGRDRDDSTYSIVDYTLCSEIENEWHREGGEGHDHSHDCLNERTTFRQGETVYLRVEFSNLPSVRIEVVWYAPSGEEIHGSEVIPSPDSGNRWPTMNYWNWLDLDSYAETGRWTVQLYIDGTLKIEESFEVR